MDFLKDIVNTILGQNEESTYQNLEELRHEQPKTTFSQEKTPEQQECDNETTIEQTIIKCQRLMLTTL